MQILRAEFELPIRDTFQLGEGPIWHQDRLFWVDIEGKKVCCYRPGDGQHREIDTGELVGTVAPRKAGGLVVALHHGFAFLDPETEKLTRIVDPEAHLPNNRFNDGKCDPAGRFWAGTLSLNNRPKQAALYVLEPDLSWRKVLEHVTISNGIVWSHDHRTMFYIDTPTRQIDAFDYDPASGLSSNRRLCARISHGAPDGMTIDANGDLWVGLWGGNGVARVAPDRGEVVELHELPVSRVTACAFGGPDLGDLYVTSARKEGEPLSGSLFRFRPGVHGVRAFEFAG